MILRLKSCADSLRWECGSTSSAAQTQRLVDARYCLHERPMSMVTSIFPAFRVPLDGPGMAGFYLQGSGVA